MDLKALTDGLFEAVTGYIARSLAPGIVLIQLAERITGNRSPARRVLDERSIRRRQASDVTHQSSKDGIGAVGQLPQLLALSRPC